MGVYISVIIVIKLLQLGWVGVGQAAKEKESKESAGLF